MESRLRVCYGIGHGCGRATAPPAGPPVIVVPGWGWAVSGAAGAGVVGVGAPSAGGLGDAA